MVDRAAIIENGVVINVVKANAAFAIKEGWIPVENASPGDLYNEGVFTPPPEQAEPASEPITKEQAKTELIQAFVKMGEAIGLTPGEMSGLFTEAAKL